MIDGKKLEKLIRSKFKNINEFSKTIEIDRETIYCLCRGKRKKIYIDLASQLAGGLGYLSLDNFLKNIETEK